MGPTSTVLFGGVALYRMTLGLLIGGHCRFVPSCSAYAQQALTRHPAGRACALVIRRIGRCHPWHPGGYDPVP